MIALSVNLNKIALLRNSRSGNHPSVIEFAKRSLDAGANGITIHPRPDGRHIRDHDVKQLSQFLKRCRAQNEAAIEFNIEGNPFAPAGNNGNPYAGLLAYAELLSPDQVTLVPDGDGQLTSDHGFNLTRDAENLAPLIERFQAAGCRVSLFMDADAEQMSLAREVGADRIELYTGPFAWAKTPALQRKIFAKHCDAALAAHEAGLAVNAGHDLDLENLLIYRKLPHLEEVSIGHGITMDALLYGWHDTLARYRAALDGKTSDQQDTAIVCAESISVRG